MQEIFKATPLSTALRSLCDHLRVQVISQGLTAATAEEQGLLGVTENSSWIREVYLVGDGVRLVQARVVVPHVTYKQFQHQFDSLGDRFLGEAFLYQVPHTRSPFTFAFVDNKWHRQSVFDLGGFKLLVKESFLLYSHA